MSSNDGKMKRPLVPRLRFPEFRNQGEWENYQLGQCLSKHPEYGINAAAVPYSENLPTYLRITDISEDGQIRPDQKVSVAKDVTDENYLEDGDIVLARTGASVGRSYKYRPKDGRLVFAGFLIRVRPNQEMLTSELLFQFFATEQYWRWVDFTSARSGQPGINGNEYASLNLQLPPTIKEQQRIANCLSSLDDLITLESKKLEALKTHKNGLMQQIFPREGEPVPRLRFPEFWDQGEWKSGTIGETCETFSGGTPSTSNKEFYDGTIPFIRSAEIGKRECALFLTEEGLSKSAAKIVRKDDVLIALYGANSGEVSLSKLNGAINQAILCIRHENNNAFLYQYLSHKKDWIVATYIQGGQGNLSGEIVKSLRINFPHPDEQQKIADCLSSMDELITLQEQKVELHKYHKKGLMQQIFPTLDEMSP